MKSFEEIADLMTEHERGRGDGPQEAWTWTIHQVNLTFGKWPMLSLEWVTRIMVAPRRADFFRVPR